MNQKQICAAVEAMLFAYAEPIGADKLAQALQLPTASVESALEALHERGFLFQRVGPAGKGAH